MHLDPIQELLSQHQHIVGNKSASVSTTTTASVPSTQTSLNQTQNQHRQNGTSSYSSSVQQHQHRTRRESTGNLSSTTNGRTIPQTPLSREKSLNLKNTGSSGSNNNSSELVYSGTNQRQLVEHSGELDSSDMIENNNSKKVRPKSFWASWWGSVWIGGRGKLAAAASATLISFLFLCFLCEWRNWKKKARKLI